MSSKVAYKEGGEGWAQGDGALYICILFEN